MKPTHFPPTVSGTISPYPTVVMVTTAHQNDAGIDVKAVPGLKLDLNQYLALDVL